MVRNNITKYENIDSFFSTHLSFFSNAQSFLSPVLTPENTQNDLIKASHNHKMESESLLQIRALIKEHAALLVLLSAMPPELRIKFSGSLKIVTKKVNKFLGEKSFSSLRSAKRAIRRVKSKMRKALQSPYMQSKCVTETSCGTVSKAPSMKTFTRLLRVR